MIYVAIGLFLLSVLNAGAALGEVLLPVISLPDAFAMDSVERDARTIRAVAERNVDEYLSNVTAGTDYSLSADFVDGRGQRPSFFGSGGVESQRFGAEGGGLVRLFSPKRGWGKAGARLGPWKERIVSTVFWVGEGASRHNPVPNYSSAWNQEWWSSFGGADLPGNRVGFLPARFVPHANPFYVALPYNDLLRGGQYRPEASRVIPWFYEAIAKKGFGVSTLEGHWLAIRNREGEICYAQWEDVGPFQTDHWQYVFGSERPRPNRNGGAGLDVSPAVRDYLGLGSLDIVDWTFVDEKKVPDGPWKWAYRRKGVEN